MRTLNTLKRWQLVAGLLAAPACFGQAAAPPAPAPASLNNNQASYLFGLTFGSQLKNIGISTEIAQDSLSKGIADALQGKQPSPAEQQQLQGYITGVITATIARNEAAAASFLTKNKAEKGVVTTASGLQYKVLAAGKKDAAAITLFDQVSVQYRGKLLDGTEFDSSYSRGVPAVFPVNGVIKGWQEALVLMKPGAHWLVWVPPELGYGKQPRPQIPGGSLLAFDVELLSAEAPPGSPSAPNAPNAPPKAPPGTPRN
jgi:FKBP-type peptidyl-prolyl cis-trans isomerase